MPTIIHKVTRDATTSQLLDRVILWPQNAKLEFIDGKWQEKGGENPDSPGLRSFTVVQYEYVYGKPPLPGERKVLKITSSESIKPRLPKSRMPKGLIIGLLRRPKGAKTENI